MSDIQNHCRNYLPHIEEVKSQFVTFRLYDSLPRDVVSFYKKEAASLKNKDNQSDGDSQRQKRLLKLIDRYEDAGYGQCFLKDERVADMMVDTLRKHDGEMYRLMDWCVMPNHVHVMLNVEEEYSLSQILHSWRSYSAHKGNEIVGRQGQFWMGEYFDRFIRGYEHGLRVSNYIVMNPVKAGLVAKAEDWRWSSAFRGLVREV